MPKTRSEKESLVNALAEAFGAAKSLVFVDFRGLKAKDTAALRRLTRQEKVGYVVAKKTIMKLAFSKAGQNIDPSNLDGTIGVFMGNEDEVQGPKLVAAFAKEHEQMKILSGALNGVLIAAEKVKQLAALPSREQLLGRLVGTLNAPISGFVNILAGNLRGLVTVLAGVRDKK
ncbi:MAG: 50S ribosomal protein L10, large subunit ribosomal protein L10 [Candidatus Magasanikbacteria bacterium]|nr:50S ribosomal protein L10, large subunit ribosomal protein L10 [Candidatus Magasanikbacteria bacterium]